MNAETLAYFRCPLDPERAAGLVQERDTLVCQGCRVRYPVKQGLPVLVVAECELPEGTTELSQLPCQRRRERRKS
jgi:uncharacterized protein